MAKSNPVGSILSVGAVLVIAYFGYKVLFSTSTAQAASSANYQQSTLSKILQALTGNSSGKSSGASSGKSSGASSGSSGSASSASRLSGINPLQTLADFVNIGNSELRNNEVITPWTSVFGSGLADYQISNPDPILQSFDVSQFAQDFNLGLEDWNYSNALSDIYAQGVDATTPDYTIPYESYEYLDLAGSDYGGDW
jgi:hypothetical protein